MGADAGGAEDEGGVVVEWDGEIAFEVAASPSASASVPLATQTFGSYSGFISGSGASARAVYVFDNDPVGTTSSTCSIASGRAAAWPAVPVPAGVTPTSPWASITGTNGQPQLTVSGHPLYTFAGDSAGTDTGDGSTTYSTNNTPVWHLETTSGPAPNPGTTPASSPTPILGYY
ncbi:MAG: hypothetical protein WCE44_15705 [Candidatus Velthaea sp.]